MNGLNKYKATGEVKSQVGLKNLIFVDCEASGPAIGVGELTEFGAVHYPSQNSFYGLLIESEIIDVEKRTKNYGTRHNAKKVFEDFANWIDKICEKGRRPLFVSDNPAFDWQWINQGFWIYTGKNPFGHSARRISDFYAGLVNDFSRTQDWKKLRITPHDHNPVHDALGNLEAFKRLLKGER